MNRSRPLWFLGIRYKHLRALSTMRILFTFFLISFFTFQGLEVKAQGKPRIVQFSGLVVSGDSSFGIPGVHVFIPKSGRGSTTNYLGYFSMPTLEGDSVMIKAVGYKDKKFVIPTNVKDDKWSLIVHLSEDTLTLPVVEIFPWPTEQIFKEAFISLHLPEQDMNNMNKNLNEQVMKRMMYNMDADGAANHSYYMTQQATKQESRFFAPTISLLNPFAWQKFIESVQRGDLKQNSKDTYYDKNDNR
jgi:hypothetical protein